MLVLTRKTGQAIRIGETVTITVVQLSRHRVRIGIDAPDAVTVHRGEIFERIQQSLLSDGITVEMSTAKSSAR
ncbi:MAG TPA: carbon storage regulator CsrA [Pirellulales bacterium]|jgi:carbon storage regulator